jgi:hypothetical protein
MASKDSCGASSTLLRASPMFNEVFALIHEKKVMLGGVDVSKFDQYLQWLVSVSVKFQRNGRAFERQFDGSFAVEDHFGSVGYKCDRHERYTYR